MGRIIRRGVAALLIVASLLTVVIVGAAVKPFDGVGRYVMSDFENPDIAKQRARQRAEKAAKQQAGIYLKTYSRSVNNELTDEEISAVTNNITNIVGEVKYDKKIADADGEQVIIWTATLTANIDPDGIFDFIKRDAKEKVTIIQQNDQLQDAIAKNDKQVEDLKEKYQRATTQAEKDNLRKQMTDADRDFLANQKFEEGIKLYYEKNYEESIKFYDEVLNFGEYSNLYNNRGACYSALGQYEQAIQDFNKAIKLNPNNIDSYFNRGLAYSRSGKYDKAIKDFSKIIKLNPYYAEAYYVRGLNNYYVSKGHRKINFSLFKAYSNDNVLWSAIEDFNKAIALNPNYVDAYCHRGNVYTILDQFEQAIQDFNKAIELNPNYFLPYLSRGLVYAMIENFDQAFKDLDRGIELNPNYATAYYFRGIIYQTLGYTAKAQADFAKAKELGYNG